MSKIQGFLLHLAISMVVVGAALAVIFLVWYPRPYFEIAGAVNVVRILVGVDLVLGPALTLLFYRPGKPGVVLDLCIIATIQLVALTYGVWTIYSERPLYMVFAVDRFVMVGERDIDPGKLAAAILPPRPATGPLYVVATLPEDLQERQQLMMEVIGGKPDIEFRPGRWRALDEEIDTVRARIMPLSELGMEDDERVMRFADRADQVGFVPVTWKVDTARALVVDRETARPVGVIDVNPWKQRSNAAAGGALSQAVD
jgi:hypothetical protein